MIRTKIVATMGPAVAEQTALRHLLSAGVDVCRLNFSHGTLDEHAAMLASIREAVKHVSHPVAVLGDLGGPKIRLGEIPDHDGTGGLPIEPGDELFIQRQPTVGGIVDGRRVVSSTYHGLIDDVRVGDRLLVEDGLLRFVCTAKERDRLVLQCTAGGVLKTRKGINLPNSHLQLPSITEKDWRCVDWAIDNDLDYLALSFVRQASDLKQLRERLDARKCDIHVVAKIEKAEAITDIENVVATTDALMVARGDLGVEMDLAQVPILQKDLIRRCRRMGVPVIVATQMLQSMVDQVSPTRAEVSDVANAIFDGTDAVMLSGETSVGKFPVGAVHTMGHVADTTERYLMSLEPGGPPDATTDVRTRKVTSSAARAVRRLVDDVGAKGVVVFSRSGDTPRIFGKHRFPVPIIALSDDIRAVRRMALYYGVLPVLTDMPADMTQLVMRADALVRERGVADVGDRLVVAAGGAMGAPGTMNGILIHTVGTTGRQEVCDVGARDPH